jgi:hypothetical protein
MPRAPPQPQPAVTRHGSRALVVRTGAAGPRTVLTGAGAVEVTAPGVDDRRADGGELLTFCDYPAGHWIHLRATNPIESAFATMRLRAKVTKGHGSRAAGLAVAFKLVESTQRRWRVVSAPHLVALVPAAAAFVSE